MPAIRGGVTCLSAMFSRKTKEKIAITEFTQLEGDGEKTSPSAVEESTGLSMMSPGRDAIDPLKTCSGGRNFGQSELHVCVAGDVVVAAQFPNNDSHFVGDAGADTIEGSAVNLTCGAGVEEVEYEGEDEGDDTGDKIVNVQESCYCDSERPVSDFGSDMTHSREFPVRRLLLDEDSARYYQNCVNGIYGAGMEGRRNLPDLVGACGHLSDPGVYHAKEPESLCSSPMMTHVEGNEKLALKKVSAGASDGEIAKRRDSLCILPNQQIRLLSYDSSSVGGERRDLASELTGGVCIRCGGSPRSDGALVCDFKHSSHKCGGYREAVETRKKKPWWKLILLTHRNIHRQSGPRLSDSLSERDVGRVSPATTYVSDVEAKSGRASPLSLNDVADYDKGRDDLRGSETEEKVGMFQKSEKLDDSKSDTNKETRTLPSDPDGGFAPNLKLFSPAREWESSADRSGLSRVEQWIISVDPMAPLDDQIEGNVDESPDSPTARPAPFFGDFGSESGDMQQAFGAGTRCGVVDGDAEMAKMVTRSINSLSTVAQFSGVGLKVIPNLGMFGSLKTLNLSANSFVRIIPGCLPKSLHSLDISRNNITVIEGLRELTRLRVLNLSFNRISRIGNGLASCTSLKEVYLVGNKISEVEGLHRLSKLVVLDLSFNRVNSTKSLGQIAANYKSLQALNLLGNPVHSNLGDELMRRFVTGVCPQLVYLNKQTLKTVSNRETLGKELKANGKNIVKPAKRGTSLQPNRRTHGGGIVGGTKSKAGAKAIVSAVPGSQGDAHHRKSHHHSRSTISKELPKGFVPVKVLPVAGNSHLPEVRVAGKGGSLQRTKSDGIVFGILNKERLWSQGGVQAH